MRDHLLLCVNGAPHEIRREDVFRMLSSYLRETRRLVGTKIVCEEGDCGACTVLVGRATSGEIDYRPINSCILQMHQLDGTHVVTVEGLTRNGELHEVQRRMVENHGAQCGFCTPGFITAMVGMAERGEAVTEHSVRRSLTGNLCRCTGYEPIIKAALLADPARMTRLDELYPPAGILAELEGASGEVRIEADGRTFYAAVDPAGAVAFKAEHPEAVIVQGGTDVGVWCNKRFFEPEAVLIISKIPELREIRVNDGVLQVGGSVTLEALKAYVKELISELWEILDLFGAPQIRNAGTLAGNIANGSPIADTLPFLYVVDAELELTGMRHEATEDEGSTMGDGAPAAISHRRISIRDFYKGYKDFDLAPHEFITRILIPLPAGDQTIRLYKVSKRHDLDISTFTAAFLMRQRGEVIDEIRIAYGGVGPVVYRLAQTEEFLSGKPLTHDVFREARAIARQEITPISDVRGSADYRFTLAERILLRFFHETAGAEVAA